MSRIRRLLWLLVLLLVGGATLLLVLQNPQLARFHFLQWLTPELPVSILLIIAFVLGAISSLLLSLRLVGHLLRASHALWGQRNA